MLANKYTSIQNAVLLYRQCILEYIETRPLDINLQQQLIANEIAPRVHNGSHWSIEAALTSQFENHIRAIFNLPIGSTEVICPYVMFNCIGHMPDMAKVLETTGARLYHYGKQPKPRRKIGHITLIDYGLDRLAKNKQFLKNLLS